MALDQDEAVRRNVTLARSEKFAPLGCLCVDEVAHQEHAPKAATELELLDPRAHRHRIAHVREHLGRLVDSDNGVTEAEQLMGHATDPAAELEDFGASGNRLVNKLRLAARWQPEVQVDRASVAGGRHYRPTA